MFVVQTFDSRLISSQGETANAMIALSRLGEDVETVLRELAFGTVSRFLRSQVIKELVRLGCFNSQDLHVFETISNLEVLLSFSETLQAIVLKHQIFEVVLMMDLFLGLSERELIQTIAFGEVMEHNRGCYQDQLEVAWKSLYLMWICNYFALWKNPMISQLHAEKLMELFWETGIA